MSLEPTWLESYGASVDGPFGAVCCGWYSAAYECVSVCYLLVGFWRLFLTWIFPLHAVWMEVVLSYQTICFADGAVYCEVVPSPARVCHDYMRRGD